MSFFRRKPISLSSHKGELKKILTALDLTLIGIGAILGAGLFVLTGIAAATKAGPAIMVSYALAGVACSFAALSYAELASSIGGSGSAYGYAYSALGEFIAWIVGWTLILEYGAGSCVVAIGWSGYLNSVLLSAGITIPDTLVKTYWEGGGVNLFAMLLVLGLTYVLSQGIKQSARLNMFFVLLKFSVIAIFSLTAISNLEPTHWLPFTPFGWSGVAEGAALVFFAFVGFDAVSTAADEAINPQRDLSIGTIASLLICTLIFVLVSALLTGVAHYSTLNTLSPLAETLINLGHHFIGNTIAVGITFGIISGILVFMFALSRIIYAMSKDGLLPQQCSTLCPKTQTPTRTVYFSGIIIALMAGFCPLDQIAELVSIGTLTAFSIVCVSVIVLRYTKPELPRPFKAPFVPITPLLGIILCVYLMFSLPSATWARFALWMGFGILFYLLYGRANSRIGIHSRILKFQHLLD